MSNQINESAARYKADAHITNTPVPSGSQRTRSPQQLVTDHLDLWTSTVTPKSTSGRGSNNKLELTGIKKLRELILELAVRGKLVAQNPDDEPASKLLERIEAEKAQLIKDGKLKKQKPLAAVSEDEKPFVLPEGWEWTRLGNLGNTQTGGTPAKGKAEYFNGDIPFVKPGDIDQGILKNSSEFLSEAGLNALGREVPKGSILMVCIGTIGKCAISRERCSFNQQINSITPFLPMEDYLLAGLSSSYFQEMAWSNSSSTTISILNKGKWGNICVPLPPLAEQQRIVTKVDELMALCDQLEQQSEHQLTAHQQLTDTLLATLTESANAHELHDNWQRLAQHFDLLFSGPMGAWAIDRLKDTILQLAVMGKLVPQNPEDEPAIELVKRMSLKKEEFVKSKIYQKTAKLLPKQVVTWPAGWENVQVGEICPSIVPTRDKPLSFNGNIPWVTLPDFPVNSFYLNHDNVNLKMTDDEVRKSNARTIPPNSVLMSCVGRFGLTAINRIMVTCNQQVHCFVVLPGLCPEFLSIVIKSSTKILEKVSASTTVSYLNKAKCESIQFGLPPLAEQHRIVNKVDELFALCDQLKDRLQQASETEQHLTNAIVEQALN